MLETVMAVVMFWLEILAAVAANPLIGAMVFVGAVTLVIVIVQNVGWLWGLGALTLMGLITGPALILTPVILTITLLARWRGDRSPADETTHAPRPILLEPRDANRSR